MTALTREGDVFVFTMTEGENRFSPSFLDTVDEALDEVEAAEGAVALVTTGEGKFYSNGLDLEWLSSSEGQANAPAYVDRVHGLFARVLAFPVPTVAALNGHTFAAGAMLSLSHDLRVMRSDRGFWCLPEADINIPFTPPMAALIQARLPVDTAHEAMVFGRRFGGSDAQARGIVSAAVGEDEVLSQAVQLAASLAGKDRGTMTAIKRGMYGDALGLLESAMSETPAGMPGAAG